MHSNTGDHRSYEDGDQRLPKIKGPDKGRLDSRREYEPSNKVSADIDEDVDERAIGHKLTSLFKKSSVFQERDPEESRRTVKDPLALALSHGNQPSRGARIDAELKAKDEQRLRDTGKI